MIGFGSSPLELLATDAMLRGKIMCQHFTYSAAWLTGTDSALGALGNTDVNIQIQGDADFVCQQVNFVAFSAADTIVDDPDMTTLWTMSGSGRLQMNRAQHVLNVTGAFSDNRYPGRLPYPFLLQMKNTYTINLTDLSNVATDHAHMAFVGFKVFYQGSNQRRNVFRMGT